MLTHPQFDPVAFSLGPLAVQWYGLMYLLGFFAGLYLAKYRAKKQPIRGWSQNEVDDILFYIVLGVVLGGRVGYVFFYHIDLFFENPLYLFKIWEGGMSFHGGLLGVMVAYWLFSVRKKKHFVAVADFVTPMVPPGIAFGRLGNFINEELWGRVTTSEMPWIMIFPGAEDGMPRHPSQIYQFLLEGVLLFCLLWWFSSKPRPRYAVSAFFLIGYGVFRTFAEFYREPDEHLGFLFFDSMTMGMLLSIPMIIGGSALMWWAYRKPVFDTVELETQSSTPKAKSGVKPGAKPGKSKKKAK